MHGEPGAWAVVKAPLSGGGAELGRGAGCGVRGAVMAGLAHVPCGSQDYCGQNSSLGSFSIITENVPCGTTGVTCSKAIKIFIGVSACCPLPDAWVPGHLGSSQ